eukprot:7020261-Prymnesium_polylepis.1
MSPSAKCGMVATLPFVRYYHTSQSRIAIELGGATCRHHGARRRRSLQHLGAQASSVQWSQPGSSGVLAYVAAAE